jgi:DNA-binding MurR/RpiR family transcriptional regulator
MLLILLTKQKNEESKKLKQALKNEVSCNFIDSDEEDEESEEEIAAKILNTYNTKLMKLGNKFNMDEYDDITNEVYKFNLERNKRNLR